MKKSYMIVVGGILSILIVCASAGDKIMKAWLKPLIPTLAIFVSLLALVPACSSLPTINPAVIGQWQLPGNPQHPAVTAGVSGVIDGQTYLFLAAFDSLSEQTTLRVLSLKDPQNPVEVGGLESMTPMVLDMELSGNLLYVSGFTPFLIVDVSVPASPKVLSRLSPHGVLSMMAIYKNYAFIATNINIVIVDVINPASPQEAGTFDLQPLGLRGFKISGSNLFVIAADGLYIIDISSPLAIKDIGFFPNPVDAQGKEGSYSDLVIEGKYAYVTGGASGLFVLDISNPSSPIKVTDFPTVKQATEIFASGQFAYVIDWQEPFRSGDVQHWLQVIDISNPAEPKELDNLALPSDSQSYRFVESNNYIYWFGGNPSVQIINIYAPKATN